MLTQIDVMSDNAFELPILGVTPKNSFLIKKVTGLNPPDRSLFIGDYSQDGGLYQGRRVGNRNVVLTIDLNPNPALGETVSSLRQNLYKAFIDPQVDGDYLKLVLTDETNKEIYLVGYCEKFEGEIFDIETLCQISMICPDPYLRDNEDTIVINDLDIITIPFDYQGTAETGFIARIKITNNTRYLTLENNSKKMELVTAIGSEYEINDVVVIDTIRGQRSISLTKPTDTTSSPSEFVVGNGYAEDTYVFYGPGVWRCDTDVLGASTTINDAPGNNNSYWEYVSTPIIADLLPRSQWLELHSANNTMKVYGTDPINIVANINNLKYTAAYWGI